MGWKNLQMFFLIILRNGASVYSKLCHVFKRFPVYLPTYKFSVKIYDECFVFTCGFGLNPVWC